MDAGRCLLNKVLFFLSDMILLSYIYLKTEMIIVLCHRPFSTQLFCSSCSLCQGEVTSYRC